VPVIQRRHYSRIALRINNPMLPPILCVAKVDVPDNVGIELGQCNLKACDKRLEALCSEIERRGKPWDIIVIADPPKSLPWWGSQLHQYEIWYDVGGIELSEDDNPRRFRFGNKKKTKRQDEPKPQAFSIAGAAFLVTKRIAGWRWSARLLEPAGLCGNVATLSMTADELGDIRIHGLYNRNAEIDLKILAEHCMGDSDLLLGDFNIPGSLWTGDARKNSPQGQLLEELTSGHGMRCLNKAGEITYSRSQDTTTRSSVIDLYVLTPATIHPLCHANSPPSIFASERLAGLLTDTRILDVKGFESDHRVMSHTFAVGVPREDKNRVNYRKFNDKRFTNTVRENLRQVGDPSNLPSLDDKPAIDKFVDGFCGAMTAAVGQEQEKTESRMKKKVQKIVSHAHGLEQARVAASNAHSSRIQSETSAIPQPDKIADGLAQRLRRAGMRGCGAVLAARRDIFQLAKMAASAAKPRQLAHMPDLSNGVIKNITGDDNARLMMKETFLDFSEEPSPRPSCPAAPPRSTPAPIEPDPASHTRPPRSIVSPQGLLPDEIMKIIKGFPTGKSALPDGLPYEVFKKSAPACVPYIEHLFEACLKKEYHPSRFRFAITVIIKKPGKSSYRTAASWRPIALESCLGKMLERVLTNRYNAIVIEHGLLPDTQFSAPGRSCPQALELLRGIVHRAWCPGQHLSGNRRYVSIMILDMTGAFNRVTHVKLLEILRSMGIPTWLVNITESFLSCRSTKLALPGHLSRVFYVNIGVPQGSPLSPILFALFTAGLLRLLETTTAVRSISPCAEKFVFAFADDNTISIVSKSFETNCQAFKVLHDIIMAWAAEHGASFGPSKYHIMHFLPQGMPCRMIRSDASMKT
jgi:hypothetical protein